jgi:Flp pilus assembly protein CpaB
VVSTRGGSAAVAAVTAVLAGVILLVFLTQYKHSVNGNDKLTTVLVAQRLIEKGSSGDVIASQGLYQTTRVKKGDLTNGAISDPGNLQGKVAVKDILPGQQLTATEFGATADTIATHLAGNQRAIALPLDAAHGMIGEVHVGDRVDVIGGFDLDTGGTGRSIPVAKTLLQNVLVLKVPAQAKGSAVATNNSSNVVLQVPDDQAANLAFASDNGKLWIVARPKAGAKNTRPTVVRLESVLLGAKPIPTRRSGR